MNYDIVIPITEKNMATLRVTVRYLRKNIVHNSIILIGNKRLKRECEKLGCDFIDEDGMYGGLAYENIRQLIKKHEIYALHRTGWYLQQFLKMAYSRLCKKEYYLVWDADTIPVRKISMFSTANQPYFDIKQEYHRPYFTLMGKIFHPPVKKQIEKSFISEHMMIKTEYMQELLDVIESNERLTGNTFYEKIINTILPCDLILSGFSEFETYGNYVYLYHKDSYGLRDVETLRPAEKYIGNSLDDRTLSWVSEYYALVTKEEGRGYIDTDLSYLSEDNLESKNLKLFVEEGKWTN